MVPGIKLGFDTTNDPARGPVHDGELPGRVDGAAHRRARALRAADRPRRRGHRPGGARSRDQQVRRVRPRVAQGKHRRVLGCSRRTRGASTPTLTLNGGVRWDLQMPFSPVNDIMSAVTLADVCGISGLGDGGTYNTCNFFAPGAQRRQGAASSSQFTTGHAAATTPTGTTSRRTSASRGGRTCRAACCARCSAIPSRRRSAPATRSPTSARGLASSPASSAPIPAARSA